MSRMSELSMVLDEMVSCGENMIKAANALKEMFTDTTETKAVQKKPVPEAVPAEKAADAAEETETYTFADIRKAFSRKSHEGHTEEVKALISRYGADRLSDVKKEDYPALMKDLEVI